MANLIKITNPFPEELTTVRNEYIKTDKVAFVAELNDDVVNDIKQMPTLEGLVIAHISTETPFDRYKKNLRELIRFFIYQHQGKVNYGNLNILSRLPEWHEAAKLICQEEQKKITNNNFKLFPIVDKTCYNTSINNMFFTMQTKDEDTLWTEDGELETNFVPVPLDYSLLPKMKMDDFMVDPETCEPMMLVLQEIFTCPMRSYNNKLIGAMSVGVEKKQGDLVFLREVLKSKANFTCNSEDEYTNYTNQESGELNAGIISAAIAAAKAAKEAESNK